MTRSCRRFLAVSLLLSAPWGATSAVAEPSPPNATVPPCISLVGSYAGVPAHAAGQFYVVMRDLANNPMPDAVITIDLSNIPELQLCADQLDPDVVVNCPLKTVSKRTDATGTAFFTILGRSHGAAVTLQHAGRVFANGSLIAAPTVSAFDLDGAAGIGVNDLSVWLTDFGTPGNPAFGRSDFDCSGTVGINDFSILLTAYGRGDQLESCTGSCP